MKKTTIDKSWDQIKEKMSNQDSIFDIYHMVLGLMYANVEQFKKLESQRMRAETAKSLLSYFCRMDECFPEDLDHIQKKLITEISGYSNIEKFLEAYPFHRDKKIST